MLAPRDVIYSHRAGLLFSNSAFPSRDYLESRNRVVDLSQQQGALSTRRNSNLHITNYSLESPQPPTTDQEPSNPSGPDVTQQVPGLEADVATNSQTPPKSRRMSGSAVEVSQSIAAQQLQIIKMTDKVLLLRTQMLHQQGNVDASRNYFNQSLSALNSAIQHWQPSIQRKSLKKKKNKRKKQSDVYEEAAFKLPVADSASLVPSVPDHTPEQSHPVSGDTAANTAAPDPGPSSDPSPSPDLSTLLNQYQTDYQTLVQEETKLRAIVDALSSLDYQLAGLHKSIRGKLRSKDFTHDLHLALENVDLESLASSQVGSKAETETPSLVAEYFDEKGNAGVFRERLDEMEFMFQEGLIERALVADRGDTLDVSDEQFQENYNIRRKNLIEDINDAESKAAALAERCQEAGLDINKYRRTNPSIQAASTVGYANSGYGMFAPEDESVGVQLVPVHGVDSGSPTAGPSSSRVDNWLRHMQVEEKHDLAVNQEIQLEGQSMAYAEDWVLAEACERTGNESPQDLVGPDAIVNKSAGSQISA